MGEVSVSLRPLQTKPRKSKSKKPTKKSAAASGSKPLLTIRTADADTRKALIADLRALKAKYAKKPAKKKASSR